MRQREIALPGALRPSAPKTGVPFLLLVSTAMLLLFYYLVRVDTIGVFSMERGWTPMAPSTTSVSLHFLASALLLGLVPTVAARWLLGVPMGQLGLGVGNWRAGMTLVALGTPVAVLAGWVASRSPSMQAVYPLNDRLTLAGFPLYAALASLYFGAWEVLFRGVLLAGLRRRMGDWDANGVQTGLSVTAHFGRAMTETFSAFPAGLLFGWLALRLRSVWYVAFLHWTVAMSMEFFILSNMS
jgi:membrane protease YdiL (CAAX protease family)